ncbi:endospore germination permease [Clostridium malenominatum]|uniref:Endospore germination permease n=1 Tax=Clostridium malenominatum TaxID=1539 RepID=A0ABP3UGF6_9CLOT
MEIKNNILTPIEFMSIIIGNIIGVGILVLPANVSKYAYEDGWISIILGSIYPFYICLLGIYISKIYPDKNILFLSRKYFGKIVGNILNFLFFTIFIYNAITGLAPTGYILVNFLSFFLNKNNTIFLISLVALYTVFKDLKLIGRLNIVMLFITIFLLTFPLPGIKEGQMLNIRPVFKSSISQILKGAYETIFSYTGIEVFFLIYPYVENKKKIKSYSLKACLFVLISYSWVQFICLYYLGSETINKVNWPLITTTETLIIPLINNMRYIFIFLWVNIIIKTISNNYFFSTYIFADIIGGKIDRKFVVILVFPVILFISTYFENAVIINNFIKLATPFVLAYTIFFITIIAILVKKDVSYGKNV